MSDCLSFAFELFALKRLDEHSEGILFYGIRNYNAHGKLQESFIAKKGFFYLENVSTGEFNATVKRYTKDCTLHLTIPKTDKVIVNLGDVLCVSN